MYGLLSIERTRREPAGPYGAVGGGQRPAPQPAEAPGTGSFSLESGRHSRRLGHRSESAQGLGSSTLRHADAGAAPAVSRRSAGHEYCCGRATADDIAACRDYTLGPSFLKTFALAVIGFYRAAISPALPSSCRFYPTCSVFAYEAVSTWGLKRGLWLTVRRLGRCRPFGPYGYDPVPERAISTTEGTETTDRAKPVSLSSGPSVMKYSSGAGESSGVAPTEALL